MLVLGDAHATTPDRRAALLQAYEDSGADRALQVGDLGHYRLPAPTWFVAGNNEDLDLVHALRVGSEPEAVRNLTLLASDVAEVRGLWVAGLSGNYAPTRFDSERAELSGGRRRHFTHEDIDALLGRSAVDVLLTHEAPHGVVSEQEYDPGCEHVDRLIRELTPSLVLVGHHHEHAESSYADSRVVSLAPAWESYYELDPTSLALTREHNPVEAEPPMD